MDERNFYEERYHSPTGFSITDRIRRIEDKLKLENMRAETAEKTKSFKWPFKWRSKFNKTNKRINNNKVLVFFFNKKNELETPKFMPIFDGNMVIWDNKPYEFDPRAMWKIRGVKGNPMAYCIKEIDRRPIRNEFGKIVYKDASINNLDLDEIRARGDSTESDEFLIKAALKAQTAKGKKSMNMWILVIVGIIIVGVIIWLLAK